MVLVDDERPLIDGPFRRGVGGIGRGGNGADLGVLTIGDSRIAARVVDFERLVVLDLLFDPLLERHHRQLQDLHRLDHARRKHLLLRQPHFLAERHPHGITLRLTPLLSTASGYPVRGELFPEGGAAVQNQCFRRSPPVYSHPPATGERVGEHVAVGLLERRTDRQTAG